MSGGGSDDFGVSGVTAAACDAGFAAVEAVVDWTGFAGVES
jgi:hypothetical protein